MKPIILDSKDIHYVWTANDCKIKVVDITAQEDLIKAAVEWYDFIDSKRGPIDAEGYAVKVVALSDAVRRWKEAQ